MKYIKIQKEETEKKLNELIISSKENNSENFCGAAFVTFNTIKNQEEYLSNISCCSSCSSCIDSFESFLRSIFCCCLCCCHRKKNNNNNYKKGINITKAPEPDEIIIENLESAPLKKTIKNAIFFTFLIEILYLLIFYFLQFLYSKQRDLDQNKKTIYIYLVSFGISGFTSVIDLIIEIILEKVMLKFIKFPTLTNFYSYYSYFLTLFLTINANMPLSIDNSDKYAYLISNTVTKFLINSFLTPIMWVINPKCLLQNFWICFLKNKDKITYNQNSLNKLYELPPLNIAAKYTYIMKTLLMSFNYIAIFPLGFPISLIGFIFAYWVEKYNFSKMSKRPEKIDKNIVFFFSEYLVIFILSNSILRYIFKVEGLKDLLNKKEQLNSQKLRDNGLDIIKEVYVYLGIYLFLIIISIIIIFLLK